MALVKIGWFCTAGYTETGGMSRFLQRVRGDCRWERLFPAVDKPAPKLGRPFATPHVGGATGDALVEEMLARLGRYKPDIDAVVLIDDADCRFCDGGPEALRDWRAALEHQVEQRLGRRVPLVALLASPEIEAWFLADWENGLAPHAGGAAAALSAALEALVGRRDVIEHFGCPRTRGSCTRKLSDEIASAFARGEVQARRDGAGPPLAYSKRLHGPDLLGRVDPDRVARRCTAYFAPAIGAIRGL